MTTQALPERVRALIRGPVATMAHVEALLLLRRVAPEARPVAAVAEAAQIRSLPAARRCLAELAAAGLIVAASDGGYRYAAVPADAHDAVDLLARMYNERPVTLVRAIYSRPAPAAEAPAGTLRPRGNGE